MKKYLIPVRLLDRIKFGIETTPDFTKLKENQKLKLTKLLVELWYYIYSMQREDDSIYTLKGYTNIFASDLKKFKIKIDNNLYNYFFLIEILIDCDTIERNESYKKDSHAKGYRVLTHFIDENYEEWLVDFDKIFSNMKNKNYWLKKYPQLKKQINDTYDIKIKLSEYITWLKNNIGLELKPVINNGVLERRYITQDRIFDYVNDCLKVNVGNLWFKQSDEGRFYNSTTNLSYTTLAFMQLKRRDVKEIDVRNCQPLLLSLLIDNKSYKKDVEKGIFYKRMADELGKTENEFKMLSYKYIFFTNKNLNSGVIYDALNKLYPDFINKLNELRGKIHISKELQKYESKIFVDTISNYDYKMILRHDAVLVYEEDYTIIKKLVITEFKKLGLEATIKNEH